MKKTILLFSIFFSALTMSAQTFICSTADCNAGGTPLTLLSSAPVDGSTFYIVWYVTSANAPVGAVAAPQPSATSGTAFIGTAAITPTGGTNYRISFPTTISSNQNKSTISNVDVNLSYYTSASFPATAGTASMSISTAGPLPVEFISVNVKTVAKQAIVSWSTASEINNDLFVIEKSLDGNAWIEAGVVSGAGNSSEVLNYEFVDNNATSSAKSFYRIKQIDFDGNFDYSDVVASSVLSEGGVLVYPNPATSDKITIESFDEITTFEVRNLAGQIIDVDFDAANNTMNAAPLSSGVYFINVNNSIVKLVK